MTIKQKELNEHLRVAFRFDNYDSAQRYINMGADINAEYEIFEKQCEGGYVYFVEPEYQTLYEIMLEEGNVKGVELLVKNGFPLENEDYEKAPLAMAIKYYEFEIFHLLLQFRANVNSIYTNSRGEKFTILDATSINLENYRERLLAYGAKTYKELTEGK